MWVSKDTVKRLENIEAKIKCAEGKHKYELVKVDPSIYQDPYLEVRCKHCYKELFKATVQNNLNNHGSSYAE